MITLVHGVGLGCNDYFITKGSVKNVRKEFWIICCELVGGIEVNDYFLCFW